MVGSRKFQYEQVLDIKAFSGLNTREQQGRVRDDQLLSAINYDIGRSGELTKRAGFAQKFAGGGTLGANQVNLLGVLHTETLDQLIAKVGNELYYSTDGGVTWTLILGGPWNNVEFGIQYLNIFYMVRKDATIVQWNGSTASAIAGSPFGTHCTVYKDRLFVLNTLGTGTLSSRLYFSKPGDFTATGWVSTNFIDINPGDGDVLISQHGVQETLVIFKSTSTWVLYASGDPTLWVLRNLSPKIGCTSKYTTKDFEGQLYFLSDVGVYRTTGASVNSVSNDISPSFTQQQISSGFLNKSYAGIWEEKYILCLEYYPTIPTWASYSTVTWDTLNTQTWGSLNAQYKYYVYHFRVGGWTEWQPAVGSSFSVTNFVPIVFTANFRGLYVGARENNGKVFKLGETTYQDVGITYPCTMKTKEFDFDQISFMKKSKWLAVESVGEGTLTVNVLPYKGTIPANVVNTGVDRRMSKVDGPGYFRTLQVMAVFSGVGPHTFYGLAMRFRGKQLISPNSVNP